MPWWKAKPSQAQPVQGWDGLGPSEESTRSWIFVQVEAEFLWKATAPGGCRHGDNNRLCTQITNVVTVPVGRLLPFLFTNFSSCVSILGFWGVFDHKAVPKRAASALKGILLWARAKSVWVSLACGWQDKGHGQSEPKPRLLILLPCTADDLRHKEAHCPFSHSPGVSQVKPGQEHSECGSPPQVDGQLQHRASHSAHPKNSKTLQ